MHLGAHYAQTQGGEQGAICFPHLRVCNRVLQTRPRVFSRVSTYVQRTTSSENLFQDSTTQFSKNRFRNPGLQNLPFSFTLPFYTTYGHKFKLVTRPSACWSLHKLIACSLSSLCFVHFPSNGIPGREAFCIPSLAAHPPFLLLRVRPSLCSPHPCCITGPKTVYSTRREDAISLFTGASARTRDRTPLQYEVWSAFLFPHWTPSDGLNG